MSERVQLSEHFWLEEFVTSQEAARHGVDNTPPPEAAENLKRVAAVLEAIRDRICSPITITSGYRSPVVNHLVGGAYNSAHLQGLAADIIAPAIGAPADLFAEIRPVVAELGIDQLIEEFGRWVHVGLAADGVAPRGELLRATRGTDGVHYERLQP